MATLRADWQRRKALWQWLFRAVLILALLLPAAASATPATSDDLVRVIVQRADTSQTAEELTQSLGGQVLTDLHLINSFVALVPRSAISRLAAAPGVRWVSRDGPLARHGRHDNADIAQALANTYNLSVNVLPAWQQGILGQGVTVAVVDSGITPLTAKGRVTSDFGGRRGRRVRVSVSTSSISHNTLDRFGHGTAVAGIIGGDGAISNGKYVGIAPRVNLINVKVGGDDGTGYESDLIAGLQWLYDHRDRLGVRVINLSVTAATPQSYHTSPLDAAVEVMWFNGFVVVVAAGNNGDTTLYPPANDPFVITVGAASEQGTPDIGDDTIPAWSAFGTDEAGRVKPDVVAPGVGLVTTLAPRSVFKEEHADRVVDRWYFRFSGTSASAAVVSGATALLLQKEPNLTPDQVKYRLWKSARKWPGMDNARGGHGYLDIAKALSMHTTGSANQGVQISAFLTP
ncbi:MAG: S8 family peptidase, partial [Anaerolineae bacterium]|nr:S8 family peptidase [Anaerolineae bacterium]